ncbi:uncharacterized protein [Lolium perenne]|uniref:uncharacterized protein n=1 Tax=Lolium perenne TaxID=4522 RepID=UPI0021F5B3AD|nr:guanine nucleotide-binding protein subunit gamma 4-like [Lolium perenne]
MSSGSAAFRAAAVAAVLALLVLPSLGRCPSLGPAAPPPAPVTPPVFAPALTPGLAPSVSCNDCIRALIPGCESNCSAYATASCSWRCNQPGCEECRAMNSNCTTCCNDGTCSCDCKTTGDFDCRGRCQDQVRNCRPCFESTVGFCMSDCISRALVSPCHAPNCTESSPPALETPPLPPALETPPPAPATPPAFAPVLAPGPAPPVSCYDCRVSLIPPCQSNCSAIVSASCLNRCNPQNQTLCEECRAMNSNCTTCCDDGTCSCDCKYADDFNCIDSCYDNYTGCQNCKATEMNYCMADCLSACDATCPKDPLYN